MPTKSTKSGLVDIEDALEVNTKAYHINDTLTRIYYSINNKNLIYRRADTGSSVYSQLIFNYKLLNDLNGRTIIDSATFTKYDFVSGDVKEKYLNGVFNVKQRWGTVYYLDLTITDWNKKTKYLHTLKIHKQNKAETENYLIKKNNEVQLQSNFLKNDELDIECLTLNDQTLTIERLKNNFPIAPPPFSIAKPDPIKYAPDSTFTIPLNNQRFKLTMPNNGFLHIKNNNTKQFEGLTLYTYDETFPGVSNTNEMILCTRYIMNKQEFETCKNAANQKEAIDNFWIEIGGSPERAKSLLKSYYGRVLTANKSYSSYHQGWKTDRGMIYIIFGEPSRVYKNKNGELWIYGQETNAGALRFTFNKTENPFSDNDYILERNEFYKDSWYTAVDYWRQGHVYTNGSR